MAENHANWMFGRQRTLKNYVWPLTQVCPPLLYSVVVQNNVAADFNKLCTVSNWYVIKRACQLIVNCVCSVHTVYLANLSW